LIGGTSLAGSRIARKICVSAVWAESVAQKSSQTAPVFIALKNINGRAYKCVAE
jgi:hypothetical protein